jgi:DNA repair exonuclease SbcCD ATPase subunit
MALRSPARATAPAEATILKFDDAPEFMTLSLAEAPIEDMDLQVKEAQQRLAALRAQQEEVERQKHMLETLRHKQERFVSGKKDISEKLERSLRAVCEDLEDARRRVEDLAITQKDFQDHLDELKTFLPERWHRSQLDHELDRALSCLDEAEVSYEKGMRRIAASRPTETSPLQLAADAEEGSALHSSLPFLSGGDDLATWVRRGFAFTLPLIVTLIVSIVLIKLMF